MKQIYFFEKKNPVFVENSFLNQNSFLAQNPFFGSIYIFFWVKPNFLGKISFFGSKPIIISEKQNYIHIRTMLKLRFSDSVRAGRQFWHFLGITFGNEFKYVIKPGRCRKKPQVTDKPHHVVNGASFLKFTICSF